MAGVDHDLVLAGGGLAAGLVALAFRQLRPEVDVDIVEQGPTIGGNHLWSFFDSVVNAGDRWLVDPLVAHRWPDNEVCFPVHARVLSNGYNTSDRKSVVEGKSVSGRGVFGGRRNN